MMIGVAKVVVGLLAILPLFAGAAVAAERVSVDSANPPFMYTLNGRPAGIYPALIAAAFERMGVAVEIDAVPWRRALGDLDHAEAGVAGLYKTSERLKKYDFSEKLLDEVIQLYVRDDDPFVFTGVASLKGRTVGVILGWSYGDEFDAARKAGLFKAEEVAGDGLNFHKLVTGRVDTVVAIREAAAAVLATEGLSPRVKTLAPNLSSSPSFLAFNKSAARGALLERFNAALGTLRTDGGFDLLIKAAFAN